MKISKAIAGMLAGAVMAGGAIVAAASPAFANDEGPLQSGSMLWFNVAGSLDTQVPANQVKSGTDAVNRPWLGWSLDAACPAGTVQAQPAIRVPQAGTPENDWTQVSMGAAVLTTDSQGRFYGGPSTNSARGDRMSKPEVMTYLAEHGGTGQFPLIVTCRTADLQPLGYFRNVVTMSIQGTDTTTLTWSIDSADMPKPAVSGMELEVSTGQVTAGQPVTFTGSIDPAAATGDIELFAGSTSLGLATRAADGSFSLTTTALPAGNPVSVTAKYLGGSHEAKVSPAVEVIVEAAPAIATTTSLVVDKVDGTPGPVALTATVSPAAAGSVQFFNGSTSLGTVPVINGAATYSLNVAALSYNFSATFTPTDAAAYLGSASAVVPGVYAYSSNVAIDEQTVTVEIPQGAITITTPYTPAAPLALGTATLDASDSTYSASAAFQDIVITDTRAGALGFTASVVSSDFSNGTTAFSGKYAGLTGLVATQVPGNALLAGQVALTDHAPFTDGLETAKVFATHAAGTTIGTAHIDGTFGVDQVPTSVTPGLYTATLTFTAV